MSVLAEAAVVPTDTQCLWRHLSGQRSATRSYPPKAPQGRRNPPASPNRSPRRRPLRRRRDWRWSTRRRRRSVHMTAQWRAKVHR
eukprot:scaffold170325_cov27-Tisochrysis_lutea.AAC.3